MKKFLQYLLAFTWELPQTLVALFCVIFLGTKAGKKQFKDRQLYYHDTAGLTWWSLGEFIFLESYAEKYVEGDKIWAIERDICHEFGHSRQSRILGPLYLILIALPSVTWNLLARMDNEVGWYCHEHYYDTPWEHWADVLGGVDR